MDPADSPRLGPVVRAFRPDRLNVAAGGVVAALLFAGAAAAPLIPMADPARGFVLQAVACAAALTAGLALLAFTVSLAFTRIDLHERGFRRRTLTADDEVAWADVARVRLNLAVNPEGRPTGEPPSVTVRTAGGAAYHFTANHVGRMPPFVAAVRAAAAGAGVAWEESPRAAQRRWAVGLMVAGLFLFLLGPATVATLADAERRAGGEPVKVHWIVYVLYEVGGKWLAGAGVSAAGVGFLAWGLTAHRRAREDAQPGG